MTRRAIVAAAVAAGLLTAGISQASSAAVETSDLLVSDATGRMSKAQLKEAAAAAQAMLDRVLAFWSVPSAVDRFGKIRVVFDEPRRDIYGSVFYWENVKGSRVRVVGVYGFEGAPQLLAHKLTSAVMPQRDKLIRNMMGILTELQVGNRLAFPICGCAIDDWVLALLGTHSYIPLAELGPDHESWGMEDRGGGRLVVHDRVRQHAAYAEAGSFAHHLFQNQGVNKLKQLQRLSQEQERPWRAVFGKDLPELEAAWLDAVRKTEQLEGPRTVDPGGSRAPIALRLFERDPAAACAEAQKLAAKRP